jgi:drug/metabolite transporter (DMT)-like permease
MLGVVLIATERRIPRLRVHWLSALALFAYAAPFSFAYLHIPAGTGALILFGAVQVTMIGWDVLHGKLFDIAELLGVVLAVSGLVVLAWPGASAPDIQGASLMAVAGIAWGAYSLLGRGVSDPLRATASNFALSLVFAVPLGVATLGGSSVTVRGVVLALCSGAVASGIGYAIWYAALRGLTSTQAGIVQLLVPVLAALGGVFLLGESTSLRLVVSAVMIFSGVTLAIVNVRKSDDTSGSRSN